MTSRRFWLFVTAIVFLTLVRVASTHLVFAQTYDEGGHVASGHEWLTRRTHRLDFQHPVLAQVLFALPFRHARSTQTDLGEYGNDLFGVNDRYIHNVASARRPNLLFLAIAAFAVAASARRLFGDAVALVAVALFLFLPPVLAHAGLATTDVPGVAGFAVAFYALLVWLDDPSWRRTLLLGVAIGFGVVCKYSFPMFFAPAMVIMLIARRRFPLAKLLVAGVVAFVVTWAVFGFKFESMSAANPKAHEYAHNAGFPERLTDVPVPAPDLWMGALAIAVHNRAGHISFLLGKTSMTGWWYYFPIALAVKTPIPFLILAIAGAALLARRKEFALVVIALAILLVGMTAHIDIGVRHILPIYVPLSIVAGFATVEIVRRRKTIVAAVALAWLAVSSIAAHPDYLPWMNAFAGRHPEHVLLDSNFDWGQDIWRLILICRKRGIGSLGYAVMTTIRPSNVNITGFPLDETKPAHGWIVLADSSLEFARTKNPSAFAWLTEHYPFERVGKTLRLYHVP